MGKKIAMQMRGDYYGTTKGLKCMGKMLSGKYVKMRKNWSKAPQQNRTSTLPQYLRYESEKFYQKLIPLYLARAIRTYSDIFCRAAVQKGKQMRKKRMNRRKRRSKTELR